MTAEQIELVRELRGTVCQCERKKMAERSFCGQCYHSLPRQVQIDLYKRLGNGYEEAYAEAKGILKGD